jgi:Flp pilus assembly protein TadG
MPSPLTGGRNARSRARSGRPHAENGQATVELALVLPLIFALLVLLFQVALVARDELLVVHAARDAAREATLTGDATRVTAAARRSVPGATVRIVRRGPVGGSVEVVITYVSRTDLPLVGFFVPDITLHGHSVMRVETP